jgi:hypothetical protein
LRWHEFPETAFGLAYCLTGFETGAFADLPFSGYYANFGCRAFSGLVSVTFTMFNDTVNIY